MIPQSTVWSYGGGTQSVAIAVLIAMDKLPRPECIVMSNTTREATETWEYTIAYTLPLFDEIGLRLEMVTADGRLYWSEQDTLPLLAAYTGTGGKTSLYCSNNWKRDLVRRYLRQKGYGPKKPVLQWLGLSLDEVGRMKPSGRKWITHHYPLIQDLKLYRGECAQIVLDYGWPPPPKSSCYICPERSNAQWRRLKEHYPDDWEKAIAVDNLIRERDDQHSLYLHREGAPLKNADLTRGGQLEMFDGCDSGHCFI